MQVSSLIIEPSHLSAEAVENIIREYCLQDWGLNEVESPLDERMSTVKKAISHGKLVFYFSEEFETVNLISPDQLQG